MTWAMLGNHGGRMITAGLLSVLVAGAVAVAPEDQQSGSDRDGAGAAGAQARPSGQDLDPRVDKILTRLERREIKDLRAGVYWRLHFVTDTPDTDVRRTGQILYQQDRPVSKFLIHFRDRRVGDTKQAVAEQHLFDGTWYVKLDQQTKTVERRQIRAERDPVDPFKLGEGPFPIPFGQSKESILREFDVELIPPSKGDPKTVETDHLMLTPRENSSLARDYKYLHFWIAREGEEAGLPVAVKAGKLKPTGELDAEIMVQFADPEINKGLARNQFKIETPRGYTESVEPLTPGGP